MGPENKSTTWNLPKALLGHHSNFFRAACYQPFKEGLENKIILPDYDSDVFRVFVQWLYYEHLPTDFRRNCAEWDIWLGFRAWVLGDKILATKFQDCIMRWIWKCYAPQSVDRYIVLLAEIQYYWQNTPPGSKLRQFITDVICQCWGSYYYSPQAREGWEDLFEEHQDFRNDLIFQLGGHKKEVLPVEAYLQGVNQEGTAKGSDLS